MLALNVQNAAKAYGKLQALKNLSLEIPQGEFFGLLGPNGAGKTTLIRAIVGLLRLDAGQISVFGHDAVQDYKNARRCIGYAPQETNLDRFFSIGTILQYQAGYFGATRREAKERVADLLEQFRLSSKANVQFFKLSGGMQKRVLIAKALVSRPKFLILDEPTAGVDVEQRHELWGYLRRLNQDGTTILLTTHYIEEAEALCSRVGLIDQGEIKVLGKPADLVQKYCEPRVVLNFAQPVSADLLGDLPEMKFQTEGSQLSIHGNRAEVMIEKVLHRLVYEKHFELKDVQVHKGDLEDVFLAFVGKKIHEKAQSGSAR